MVPFGDPKKQGFADCENVLFSSTTNLKERGETLMKTTLKLVAVAVMALGLADSAKAARIDFWLYIDPAGPGTWELRGTTDAPGGIASYAVDLMGINTTGARRGPRWTGPDTTFGFTVGSNNPQAQPTGGLQVSGGQPTSGEALADDGVTVVKPVVWGLGYDPDPIVGDTPPTGTGVPQGPPGTTLVHQGASSNPTLIPLVLHSGTYVVGASPAFHPIQPINSGFPNPGAVWTTPQSTTPIGGANGALVPFYHVIPEPGTVLLMGLAIPALAFAIRRRKAA
jgi:hypothetical protein